MITDGTLTAILAGIGTLIGSGGMVALIHELSIRHKVKHDTESQKSKETTDLMKYFTEEIKRMNTETKEQLKELKDENTSLKKELSTLNSRITALVKWIMFDNTAYRTWLENTLKSLDPAIDIPKCTEPPIEWNSETVEEADESGESS